MDVTCKGGLITPLGGHKSSSSGWSGKLSQIPIWVWIVLAIALGLGLISIIWICCERMDNSDMVGKDDSGTDSVEQYEPIVSGSRTNTDNDIQNESNLDFTKDGKNTVGANSPSNAKYPEYPEQPLTELEWDDQLSSSDMEVPPPNYDTCMSKTSNKRPMYDGQQTLWEYLVREDG